MWICAILLAGLGVPTGSFQVPSSFSMRGMATKPLLVDLKESAEGHDLEDLWEKQKAVEASTSFSHLSYALPLVMETTVYPEKGTVLFEQGDQSNGFFFVNKGSFECIDNGDKVVATLQEEGSVFGELGVLLNEKRALTVRTATPNASSWFVDTENYNLITKLRGAKNEETQINVKNQYPDYFDLLSKEELVKSLPILKKVLNKNEITKVAASLTRCSFEAGEDILVEGDDDTDMYFVESGTYEIPNSKVETARNKYFGELSFFLCRPRMVTLRATSSVSLFKLSREDLFAIVDEDSFASQNLKLLAEQYRKAGLVDLYDEILEYIQIKSRPKKKPVSFHSIIATAVTGMYILAIIPCFSPGFSNNGIPHLFEFKYFQLSLLETQIMALTFAIVAVMGSFRLPPNSSPLRRLFFNFTMLQCVVTYMLQDSNVVSIDGSRYTFDLLTVNPGSILCCVIWVLSHVWAMKLMAEAISAPDKARSSVPLNGNGPVIAFTTALMAWLLVLVIPGCFFIMDESAYKDIYIPFAHQYYKTWILTQFPIVQAGMSFCMLWATLLFEKKITQTQCSILTFISFEPILDSALPVLLDPSAGSKTLTHFKYNNGVLFGNLHINEVALFLSVGAVIYGLSVQNKYTANAEVISS